MKNILFITLAVMTFFSCREDELVENIGDSEAVVVLNINVQQRTRAVEPGHEAASGATINPTVRTVTFMAYDSYDNLLTSILLDDTQMENALYGSYKKPDKTSVDKDVKPAGATIGVPKGTTKVDVVLNDYSNEQHVTNINFFNYRDGKDGSGSPYPTGMETSYERVPLVSKTGRVTLSEINKKPDGNAKVPTYTVDFEVAPSFARFEVHGAIDVAAPEEWQDYWGNSWFTTTYKDFSDYVAASLSELTLEVSGDNSGVIMLHKLSGPDIEYGYCGAIAATEKNGFASTDNIDNNTLVFLPKYFYIHGNVHSTPDVDPRQRIDDPANVVNSYTDKNDVGKWLKNPYIDGKTITWLTWNPNTYYAVDIEEIFVNNIKVRGSNYDNYLFPWPGSEATSHWPNWYKAYHLDGWHTAGVSTGQVFMCMGNMWDRIAQNANGDNGVVSVPGITADGESSGNSTNMPVMTKKAAAVSGKSEYYSTTRNLGITKGKAAGYQIYPQRTGIANTDANKDQLGSVLPHIIVKVKAYKTQVDYVAGSSSYEAGREFVTLKLFRDGNNKRITDFAMGSIYRLDLSSLKNNMVGAAPIPGGTLQPADPANPTVPIVPKDPFDPDPEMPGANVEVTVKVIPWTVQNITPEI